VLFFLSICAGDVCYLRRCSVVPTLHLRSVSADNDTKVDAVFLAVKKNDIVIQNIILNPFLFLQNEKST